MRRRILTDKEMKSVVKLRQTGSSWLRIEKETKIPRRSAQRAYEEWERNKSGEELVKARIDVAAEEFRRHMDDLIALAQSLVNSLYTPSALDEMDDADQVLEPFWKRDARQEDKKYYGNEEQRLIRRNKLLFESLKQHTREKVRWQALEEWIKALKAYIGHCKDLRAVALEVLGNILDQRKGLRERLTKLEKGKGTVNEMGKGVVETIWRSIRAIEPDLQDIFVQAKPLANGVTEVSFGKDASRIVIRFTDSKLAEEVADVCRWAATNVLRGEKSSLVVEIARNMATMEKQSGELDRMLDELILRPIILHTRCDLCPA